MKVDCHVRMCGGKSDARFVTVGMDCGLRIAHACAILSLETISPLLFRGARARQMELGGLLPTARTVNETLMRTWSLSRKE
jgi:hypothetical protein